MRYVHLLLAVAAEYWAIEEGKLDQLVAFLALQSAGEKLSSDEILARTGSRAVREPPRREGAVAVLPLHGVIANRMNMMASISGGTSSEMFGQVFDAMVADAGVRAIILDVDSPGGAVSGTDELSSKIFAARGRKPIVAHVNALAASAAYWIATAADEIVLSPSAEVGSIGVMMVHDDVSAALAKAGIKRTVIAAGKHKAEGLGPLSPEARAHRIERANAYHDTFVRRVATNRGTTPADVRERFGQGRTVLAADAVGRRMADRVGTLEATIRRLLEPSHPTTTRSASHGQSRSGAFPARERARAALASDLHLVSRRKT